MNLEDFSRNQGSNVHNFCFGTVNSYFQPIVEKINDNTSFSITCKYGKNRKKRFCFAEDRDLEFYEDVCYSLFPFSGSKKRVEIAHNLDEVLDKSSYGRKKRYNTIIYPFNWAAKNSLIIRELGNHDRQQVEYLHDRWVDLKLSDEKTFKIMFPKKRYLQCFEDSIYNKNYLSFGGFLNGELISTRVLYTQGTMAFDLAFFTDYSKYSQVTNFIDIIILNELRNRGIKFLNRGIELNKGLKTYKTQFPYVEVYFYESTNKLTSDLTLF